MNKWFYRSISIFVGVLGLLFFNTPKIFIYILIFLGIILAIIGFIHLKVNSGQGCIISNRITVDGENVGYCYRQREKLGKNDSGWRFFAGDEDENYLKDPSNFGVYKLSIVCNLDKNVREILNLPYDTELRVNEKGILVKVENN
ncbi:DUF2185 domain-containing protein [Streptobacillus moniliformis]|uniref:Immunity protein Imm33 domain-containing protein n=1 Tax=Streptobacillus moniliformis (strain ATCC 14647 / DSM 12112 / NCTC 10651 / 9901) TaxID=519441 RepID=D1AW35_STRM9|nr:DUF2185 domain-containing protein [Streptobacillus moniliformis]ACZ00511.1 conserved hypothetical protein [Streptobacillus moniliformis DSM 12112]AVL43071.1 DUF2185 domain-containing protein [Streptobacillus moniliformis]QXW65282.1 DUF2185 domain-containing protein [Streptobacillus moniliformis]SQA12845.1 Protein of uncharacterised function (DUF2185) [Streptobacillus moniliformis]